MSKEQDRHEKLLGKMTCLTMEILRKYRQKRYLQKKKNINKKAQ